jgi:hypothetical protein
MSVYQLHDPSCPPRNRTTLGGHSDAAKNTAFVYMTHRMALGDSAIGHWIAVRIQDGTSDNVLYQTRREAVRHQGHNEQVCAFLNIRPCDLSVCEAASFLRISRMAHDNGFRLADPEHRAGGRSLISRLTIEDQRRQTSALGKRIWIPGRTR